MKFSKKRCLALVMASAMVMGSLSGCGKSGETASTEGSSTGADGKVTVSYWSPLTGNLAQVANSYDDTLFYQELEKRLDMDLEFMHPPVGQEKEQFQLMLASGKLPDVIEYSWLINYPGGPEKAIKDGIVIPLNDYMDQMPNFKAALEAEEINMKEGTTDSGNIFGFYTFQRGDDKIKTTRGLMFRADWLEELGLPYPETLNDWETMFEAFQEKKGAEFPIAMKLGDFMGNENFNSAYKVGNSFYVDDAGKVQYGPVQQSFKEYATTLNRWYQEGYINPDFASIDGAYTDSQIINGKAGVMYGWIGAAMGKWMDASEEEGFSVEGTVNPVMEKGEQPFLATSLEASIGSTVACVTTAAAKDEKKMEAILKFFDYLYTDEGLTLKTYGVEGTTFEMVDGKEIYTDIITNNPDGLTLGQALTKYTQAASSGPGFGLVKGYVDQYYKYDQQKATLTRVNAVLDAVEKHNYPWTTLTPEEADELAGIMAEVSTVKEEQMIAFIMGVRPMDEYDDFIGELKKLGIDRAVEIKQAALDRFNSR